MPADLGAIAVPRCWLLRSREGNRLPIRTEQGEFVVGRGPDCGLPILDAGISRRHARFLEADGELWVEDLGSQNGTFVNGDRVVRAPVHPGDILIFGRIPFTLQARPREEEPAEAGIHRCLGRLPRERLLFLVAASLRLSDPGTAGPGHLRRVLDLAVGEFRARLGAILGPGPAPLPVLAAHPCEGIGDRALGAAREEGGKVLRAGIGRLSQGKAGPPEPAGIAVVPRSPSITAPLVDAGGEPVGILFLEAAGEGSFGAADLGALEAYGVLAGRAIEMARRLSGNRRREQPGAERTAKGAASPGSTAALPFEAAGQERKESRR